MQSVRVERERGGLWKCIYYVRTMYSTHMHTEEEYPTPSAQCSPVFIHSE